ncbi:MAG: DUF2752 domain-containing protein [Planctomycetota bacterium]|nr:DUF2752 domain-containing protein [Planctomycetota bacterium]
MITTIPVSDGPQRPWLDRLVAATVSLAAVLCTTMLASVTPDPRGYDTHVKLGMVRCSWPMHYGLPCPTCGATTAACHVVHGNLVQALIVQPFGAALAIAGMLFGLLAIWCLLRSRSFFDVCRQLPGARLVVGGTALLLLSWLYKYLTFTKP